MKLIDIERVKTEIKRRQSLLDKDALNVPVHSRDEYLYYEYENLLSFLDTLPEEKQEDLNLVDKAIYWFKVIAEDMERLTSGNLPHNAAITKGRAIRAYEFLGKHKNDVIYEDCLKIKGYVARDKNKYLCFYRDKPHKDDPEWQPFDCNRDMQIESHLFPEVTWKDEEPTEVELIIKKV